MNVRRSAFVFAVLSVIAAGSLALADPISFPLPPPDNDCRWVSCAQCPDGYYFSPTPDDCCRCVPFETY